MRAATLVIALAIGGLAQSALAQEAAPAAAPDENGAAAQTQQGGPLVIERIHNPFVVAPEYKVTHFNGDYSHQLAGGYVGTLVDEQLLVAGAIYTLVNGSHDLGLTYGGLMLGWSTRPEARLRFGGRALIGGGTATIPQTIVVQDVQFGGRGDPRFIDAPPVTRTVATRARDDFFVFEPEANAVTRITDHIGIDLSVGYRVTGWDRFLRDSVDGVTGSLALQFGW
jgi:hypothetical protein